MKWISVDFVFVHRFSFHCFWACKTKRAAANGIESRVLIFGRFGWGHFKCASSPRNTSWATLRVHHDRMQENMNYLLARSEKPDNPLMRLKRNLLNPTISFRCLFSVLYLFVSSLLVVVVFAAALCLWFSLLSLLSGSDNPLRNIVEIS